MKSVAMSGSPRANVGKKDAAELRRKGMVPCVLYGGEEQVTFAVEEAAFKHLVYTPEVHSVDIDVNGKTHKAILQELQLHPVTDRIIHADFLEVVAGKPVTVKLPVKIEGNSVGVRAGGKLIRKMRKLAVSGLLEKMPEHLTVNIDNLEIGDVVLVKDMSLDGLTFLDSPGMTIVTVSLTRNVAEEDKSAPAATAAAPAAAAADAAKK